MPIYGTLPTAWGGHKTFPALLDFRIGAADTAVWHDGVTQLSGSLPPQWGSNGSFERLQQLWIANLPPGPGLSGSLPPEWGSPGAWQNLQHLFIANTQGGISGTTLTNAQQTYFTTAAGTIAVQTSLIQVCTDKCFIGLTPLSRTFNRSCVLPVFKRLQPVSFIPIQPYA